MAILLTRKQSIALGIGLLGVFFTVSASLVAWNSRSRVPKSSSLLTAESVGSAAIGGDQSSHQNAPSSGFVLNEFKRNLVRDGRVVWEIVGRKGQYAPGNNSVEIEAPLLTLSTKSGDPAVVTAGRAVLEIRGADLLKADLFDDVVLRYKNDTTLKTTQASYDKITEMVTIPVYVEIENGTGSTTANRLSGNVTTQEFILEGGVSTTLKPQ